MNTSRSCVFTAVLLLILFPALVLASSISGSIRDESWNPLLETVEVSIAPYQSENWQTLVTDNGTYSFTGLSAGSYWLFARCLDEGSWYVSAYYPGSWMPDWVPPVDLQANMDLTFIDIPLMRGGRISGSVLPGEGGSFGNGDVAVSVFMGYGLAGSWPLNSPASFLSPALPIGEMMFCFHTRQEGDYHVPMFVGNTWHANDAQTVNILPETTVPVGEITLPLGGAISGIVTGEGEPLEYAWINAFILSESPFDPWDFLGSVTTENDGSFLWRGVPAGQGVILEIYPPEDSPYSPEWYDNVSSMMNATVIDVQPGQLVSGIDVDLLPGANLFGTLRNSDGSVPTPDHYFDFSGYSEDGESFWLNTQVDAQGNWQTLSGVPAGIYTVSVQPQSDEYQSGVFLGNTIWPWEANWLNVGSGETYGPFALQLKQGGAIRGTVLDPNGNPTPDASVLLYIGDLEVENRSVDWDGSFQIRNLPVGSYRLAAVQQGEFDPDNAWPVIYSGDASTLNGATPVTVSANSVTNIDLQFAEGAVVTVSATDMDGNSYNPFTDDMGIVLLPVSSGDEIMWRVRSDSDEPFIVESGMRIALHEGSWTFVAIPVYTSRSGENTPILRRTFLGGGYTFPQATFLNLTAGGTANATITLPEMGHAVTGHLETVTGSNPKMNPTVLAVDGSGHIASAYADFFNFGLGTFKVGGLPDGDYRFFVTVNDDISRYVNTWYPNVGDPGSSESTLGDWPVNSGVVTVNGGDVGDVAIVLQTGSGSLGVRDREMTNVPNGYVLAPAWPNPFNASTTISFFVPATSRVRIELVNVLGRRVALLEDGSLSPGVHHLTLDGKGLSSGVYFVRMNAGSFHAVQKVTLLK